MHASLENKILTLEKLQMRLRHWRTLSGRVVFTNGCFDLLHRGHVELLTHCRALGDYVIVGLNSDSSVKKLKGETRPIHTQANRAIVLAALYAVDAVIIFEEENPRELIATLRPDVLVKGGDYAPDDIVGADIVRAYGGQVVIVPLIAGLSTTATLARLQ